MAILDRLFKLIRKKERKPVKTHPKISKQKPIRKKNLKRIIERLDHPELLEGLDETQKSAILTENPRTLVLAGAGAGKTKTLLFRILHLLKNSNVKSGNILAMTFTREATLEMLDKLIAYFEPEYMNILKRKINPMELNTLRRELLQKHPEIRSITLRTIHSLCVKILKTDGAKIFNTNFKVIGDEEKENPLYKPQITQQEIIKSVISEICKEDQNFIEQIKKFIYDYLIDYDKLTNNKEGFTKSKYITLDGKDVRSKSERDIANFFVQNKIRYVYEKEATWVTKDDKTKRYRPDFYLPDYDIYLEHWWVSSPNDKVSEIFKDKFDKDKYLKEREWKLGQFREHKKILIESSEKQMQGKLSDYYDYLYGELLKNTKGAIKFTPSMDFIQEFKYLNEGLKILITHLMKIINLAKSNRVSKETIQKNLQKEKHEEVLEFYEILQKTYEEYEEFLIKKSLIDYNDMIHKVIELFEKDSGVLSKYQKMFKHILVDEY